MTQLITTNNQQHVSNVTYDVGITLLHLSPNVITLRSLLNLRAVITFRSSSVFHFTHPHERVNARTKGNREAMIHSLIQIQPAIGLHFRPKITERAKYTRLPRLGGHTTREHRKFKNIQLGKLKFPRSPRGACPLRFERRMYVNFATLYFFAKIRD